MSNARFTLRVATKKGHKYLFRKISFDTVLALMSLIEEECGVHSLTVEIE